MIGNKVVITGIGVLAPNGNNVDESLTFDLKDCLLGYHMAPNDILSFSIIRLLNPFGIWSL